MRDLPGEAIIARVRHVQSVGRQHRRQAHLTVLGPMAHDGKAMDDRRVLAVRHGGERVEHLAIPRMCQHGRCVLQVHQHDVGAGRLEPADATPQHLDFRGDVAVAEHGVGAKLPNDEIGLLRQDVTVEARGHLLGHFAADAAIDHPNLRLGQVFLQNCRKPARIGEFSTASADALGR